MNIIKKLSSSQKIAIISLIVLTIISLLYLFHLNNQRKLSQCRYLYEQGILSSPAQEAHKKLKTMTKNGSTQDEINNYWSSLDKKIKENITNIVNLVGKDGDVNKVAEDCRNFFLNP